MLQPAVPARIGVRSVTKRFSAGMNDAGALLALSGVTFDIADREVLCLLGPSGCGKTTILNIVAGFDQPSEGTVSLDGTLISGPGPDRAVVFQSPALFPWRTVAANIGFPLQFGGKCSREDIRRQTEEYIGAVGLQGFRTTLPLSTLGRYASACVPGEGVDRKSSDIAAGRAVRRA